MPVLFPNLYFHVPVIVTGILLLGLIYISIFGVLGSWSYCVRRRAIEAVFIAVIGFIFVPNVTMGGIPQIDQFIPGHIMHVYHFAAVWFIVGSVLSVVSWFIKHGMAPSENIVYVKPKEAAAPAKEDRNINVTINQVVSRQDDEEAEKQKKEKEQKEKK